MQFRCAALSFPNPPTFPGRTMPPSGDTNWTTPPDILRGREPGSAPRPSAEHNFNRSLGPAVFDRVQRRHLSLNSRLPLADDAQQRPANREGSRQVMGIVPGLFETSYLTPLPSSYTASCYVVGV